MKVIFTQDVRGRGKRGQVKDVPDGYAQNYLIKRGLAKEATKGNMNILKRVEANEKAAYEAERPKQKRSRQNLKKTIPLLTSNLRLVLTHVCLVQSQVRRLWKALKSNTVSRLINASLTCQNQLRLWAILMFMPNYLRV